MNLIKEIVNEKLVIMDRHNSNLVYKYSTRIVKFFEGQLIDESNPSEEEEQKEIDTLTAIEVSKYEEDFLKIDKNDEKAVKKFKKERNAKEKANMSSGQILNYQLEIHGVSLIEHLWLVLLMAQFILLVLHH